MKYVQHKSGRGEKWKVYSEGDSVWMCSQKLHTQGLYLPKSEYVVVHAPERWVDVTSEIQWSDPENKFVEHPGRLEHLVNNRLVIVSIPSVDYRLRKVLICTGDGPSHEPTKQWAFIVEQREDL